MLVAVSRPLNAELEWEGCREQPPSQRLSGDDFCEEGCVPWRHMRSIGCWPPGCWHEGKRYSLTEVQ